MEKIQVNVKFSAPLLARVDAAAAADHRTRSSWIRCALERALSPVETA